MFSLYGPYAVLGDWQVGKRAGSLIFLCIFWLIQVWQVFSFFFFCGGGVEYGRRQGGQSMNVICLLAFKIK